MTKKKREHGQRSRTGETKGEIIKYALEHGGMFEEAVLKDFIDDTCNVRRGTTREHLEDLNKKGIFEKTGEKGYTNTWQIVEDTKAIAIIYKEYPHLSPHLRQSDFILDCVARTESMLFEDEAGFEELKKMLRLSSRMFELCLTVDNLGTKFALLSSKLDFYGPRYVVFEQDWREGAITHVADCTPLIPSERGEVATMKHYIRWELFRTALKIDPSFLNTPEIAKEIDQMFEEERVNRNMVVDVPILTENGFEYFTQIVESEGMRPEEIKKTIFKNSSSEKSKHPNQDIQKNG